MSKLISGPAAIRSLDAIRRANHRRRTVGAKAWQERAPGNVLALPPERTVGHSAKPRRTGQGPYVNQPEQTYSDYVTSEGASGMPKRSNPNMCSGKERYLSKTESIPVSSVPTTISLETPGAFCPKYMYIVAPDLDEIFITSIKSGLEEQVISGDITAQYFSVNNPCCPVACFPCLCMPGVPLEVTVYNTDLAAAADVTVGLVGDYYNVCPPNGQQMVADMRAACGNSKLIGFSAAISDNASVDFSLETPGKFCPSNIFFVSTVNLLGVFLDSAEVALEENIIGDGFPVDAWSNTNESCCLPFCVQCLCMPGVPLNLTVTQTEAGPGAQTINGVVQGSYAPAC